MLKAYCTYTLLGAVKNNFMTIFKLKNKTRELRVCLKSRKHTNHNWYKRTEIGGTFAPKTIAHSFGFLWLGRIIFYCT